MPFQTDAASCGAFAVIVAKHLVFDAKLPNIQSKIGIWRRRILIDIFVSNE